MVKKPFEKPFEVNPEVPKLNLGGNPFGEKSSHLVQIPGSCEKSKKVPNPNFPKGRSLGKFNFWVPN